MELVYQLQGAGWANASVSNGSTRHHIAVSYLSDALGDMARATVHLLQGGRETSFNFQDEPGAHRWCIVQDDRCFLGIRIEWFAQTFPPCSGGVKVFECDCHLLEFAGQVLAVLAGILEKEGIEGYKQRCQKYDFPVAAFEEIKKLIIPGTA